jgi:hypothetical protein
MLCFSVDSPDSLENVETKWVGEIAENCPGVKLVLVALKCDLRKRDDDDAENAEPEKPCIDYEEGLRVAEKIKALRYLGMTMSKHSRRGRFADGNYRMLRHEEQRCQRSLHRSRPRCAASQDKQGQERWLHYPLSPALPFIVPLDILIVNPCSYSFHTPTLVSHSLRFFSIHCSILMSPYMSKLWLVPT